MAGGGPERYHNVNPYSDQAVTQLQDTLGGVGQQTQQNYQNYQQSMGQVPTNIQAMQAQQPAAFDMSRLGAAETALMGAANNFDPMQSFDQISQVAPLLQGLAGPSSGYEANLMQQAQRAGNQGMQNVAQQFGNMGGLFSGAASGAMTEAAINPMLAAQGQIMGMTNQNYQGMLSQGLNQLGQANQFGAGLGMQGAQGLLQGAGMGLGAQEAQAGMGLQAGLANQGANLQAQQMNQAAALERARLNAGMYGTSLGAQSNLAGMFGQMGAPEMIYQPTVWESIIGPLVGGGIEAGGNIAGAAIGASDGRFKTNVNQFDTGGYYPTGIYSDADLKERVTNDKKTILDRIRVVTWDWKPNIKIDPVSRKMRTGVIAQEVEKFYPDAVIDFEDMKKVNYGAFVPLLIKEVQDLKEEIRSLKGEK